MASASGNVVKGGSTGSAYEWYAYVEANVTAETKTSVTYAVALWYYTRWAIDVYSNGSLSGAVSGSWSGSMTGTNAGTWNKVLERSVTFTKGASAQSKSFTGRIQNTGGFGNGTSTATLTITVPARQYSTPKPPADFAASRVDDAQMALTWVGDYTGMDGDYPWTGVYVDRKTDDGAWQNVATLNWDAVNYTDRTTSENHGYTYGLRSYGPGGTSDRVTVPTIYTTPAAPASVELSKTGDLTVSVNADISGVRFAEGYEVESSVNGGGWVVAGTAQAFPFAITVAGGTVKVRVRSVRDDLSSAWVESSEVTTIIAPNAPTITKRPAAVIPVGETMIWEWKPNHPDGTEQTAARVTLTINGTAQTQDISGTGTSFTVQAPAEAATVSFSVQTKGLAAEWGEPSQAVVTAVAVPPQASFTNPGIDGLKIGGLPLVVEWDAVDVTGIASQSLQLLGASGNVLHSVTPDNAARGYSFGAGTYQLANATDYTLRLVVGGGSSLSVTAERTFSTSFAEPSKPSADITLNADALSQAVTVYAGATQTDEAELLEVEGTAGTLILGFAVFGNTAEGATVEGIAISPTESVDGAEVVEIDMQGHTLNRAEDGTRDELRVDGAGNVTLIKRTDGEEREIQLGSVEMPEFPASTSYVRAVADEPVPVAVLYPETETLSIIRVLSDGSRWLVAEGLHTGQQAIDPLPPLNDHYIYEVTASAEAGAVRVAPFIAYVDARTSAAYNAGAAAEQVVKTPFDFDDSQSYEHSGELYHFATGDELPMFYAVNSAEAPGTQGFHLIGKDAIQQAREFFRNNPVVWLRRPDGSRIRARAVANFSWKANAPVCTVSVDTQEIVFGEAW